MQGVVNKHFDARWDELAEEVLSGMRGRRLQHPNATLRKIERALGERLGKMRARMLQDAALAGDGDGREHGGSASALGVRSLSGSAASGANSYKKFLDQSCLKGLDTFRDTSGMSFPHTCGGGPVSARLAAARSAFSHTRGGGPVATQLHIRRPGRPRTRTRVHELRWPAAWIRGSVDSWIRGVNSRSAEARAGRTQVGHIGLALGPTTRAPPTLRGRPAETT